MKERPIIFSGPMVRAILEDRKTQTRRIVKPQPKHYEKGVTGFGRHNASPNSFDWKGCNIEAVAMPAWCPYGVAGDRLWVRETFGLGSENNINHRCDEQIFYRATDPGWDENETGFRWRPSIHMPRWASRITLEITEVRVERLQEISGEHVLKEGVSTTRHGSDGGCEIPSRLDFQLLWDSLHGKGAWGLNPWVWVIEFRREA